MGSGARAQDRPVLPAQGGGVVRRRYYLGKGFVVEHAPGPGTGATGTGVLLLPPFGYEDTCAYRPLRVLADALARDGHLVLRIDWPFLGDGAMEALEGDGVAEGLAVVAEATRSLRGRGLARIAGVGVRGGGLLALAAGDFDDLALWGVPASGKAYLREERAFHQTASRAYGTVPPDAPALPEGALEAGGFVFGPDTLAALQRLSAPDLASRSGARRVLLIGRDGQSIPAGLGEAFAGAGASVTASSARGLSALLDSSYTSALHPEAERAFRAWLAAPRHPEEPAEPDQPLRLQLPGGVTEGPVILEGEAGDLSGILCEPPGGAAPGAVWTLFLNAGGVRRSGPNRLWTRAARVLAARGWPSLRFDVRDVGDSDGADAPHPDLEAMYSEASIQDAVQAFEWVWARGAAGVDAVGLCSGAFLGIQLAARRPVRRALLFNGLAFVWNDDARSSGVTSHLGASLFDGRRWRRLLTGRINPWTVARAIVAKAGLILTGAADRLRHPERVDEVERLLAEVQDRGTDLRLVSSEGDPSLAYLERHTRPALRLQPRVIPGVDHTIRPVWAHGLIVDLIKEIKANLPKQKTEDYH